MIRHPSIAVVTAAGLALVLAGPAAASGPGNSRFDVPSRARQLIVVSSPTHDPPGYIATLRAYRRTGSTSRWRLVFGPWPAETGYGHLRDRRHEGDGSTPTGVFGIEATFYGNRPNPGGLRYRYHHLVCGDWWDEDPFSADYNHFVHVPCGTSPPFGGDSEALWTETRAYPYFAVTRFNTDPVRGGADAPGSGIFLHSWVAGPTAGCVALPRTRLLRVLRWLTPRRHPVVAIGTTRELSSAL